MPLEDHRYIRWLRLTNEQFPVMVAEYLSYLGGELTKTQIQRPFVPSKSSCRSCGKRWQIYKRQHSAACAQSRGCVSIKFIL